MSTRRDRLGAGCRHPWDLIGRLRRHDLVPRIRNAHAFARANQVVLLRHRATGVDLDLSLAWLQFEEEAIRAATSVRYGGVQIAAVRTEDLLIYKLIAHRPQDLEDAERLLLLHASKVDVRPVRKVLASLSDALEGPDRLVSFETLVARKRSTGRRRRSR